MSTQRYGDSNFVSEGLNVTIKHTQAKSTGKRHELAVVVAYNNEDEKKTAERLVKTVRKKLGGVARTLSITDAENQFTLALDIPSRFMKAHLVMGDIEKALGFERSFATAITQVAETTRHEVGGIV